MRHRKLLICGAAALLFLVPTCVPEPVVVNNLCGGYDDQNIFCVDSADPASVHSQVKQKWPGKPLFVFVRFGRDTGREGDAAAVEGFFKKSKTVIDYVKPQTSDRGFQKRSFERIEAAKAELVKQIDAKFNQSKIAQSDAVAALEQGLKDLVSAEAKPLVEQLEADRAFYAEATKGLSRAETDLRATVPEYQALISDFRSLKASEGSLSTALIGFANRASAATVDQLPAIEAEIVVFERQQAALFVQLSTRFVTLNGRFVALQKRYSNHLDSPELAAGVEQRGLVEADLVRAGTRAITNIWSYAQARDIEMSKAVAALLRGCSRRREALILAQADEATRTSVANAGFLNQSTAFLDQANTRIAKLLGAWPKSSKLKLPLYAAQYDEFVGFLQLEPMCARVSASNSPWMQTGCNAYAVNFDKAKAFLSTLPSLLRLYSTTLASSGAPRELLDKIQADLSANNLKGAINSYDAAVRLVDGE